MKRFTKQRKVTITFCTIFMMLLSIFAPIIVIAENLPVVETTVTDASEETDEDLPIEADAEPDREIPLEEVEDHTLADPTVFNVSIDVPPKGYYMWTVKELTDPSDVWGGIEKEYPFMDPVSFTIESGNYLYLEITPGGYTEGNLLEDWVVMVNGVDVKDQFTEVQYTTKFVLVIQVTGDIAVTFEEQIVPNPTEPDPTQPTEPTDPTDPTDPEVIEHSVTVNLPPEGYYIWEVKELTDPNDVDGGLVKDYPLFSAVNFTVESGNYLYFTVTPIVDNEGKFLEDWVVMVNGEDVTDLIEETYTYTTVFVLKYQVTDDVVVTFEEKIVTDPTEPDPTQPTDPTDPVVTDENIITVTIQGYSDDNIKVSMGMMVHPDIEENTTLILPDTPTEVDLDITPELFIMIAPAGDAPIDVDKFTMFKNGEPVTLQENVNYIIMDGSLFYIDESITEDTTITFEAAEPTDPTEPTEPTDGVVNITIESHLDDNISVGYSGFEVGTMLGFTADGQIDFDNGVPIYADKVTSVDTNIYPILFVFADPADPNQAIDISRIIMYKNGNQVELVNDENCFIVSAGFFVYFDESITEDTVISWGIPSIITKTVHSVTPVDPVTVPVGTAEVDAIADLPSEVEIVDAEGRTATVPVTWKIAPGTTYDPNTPGEYPVVADLTNLPENWEQADPAVFAETKIIVEEVVHIVNTVDIPDAVIVPIGTTEAEAIEKLPTEVKITDADGNTAMAEVSWFFDPVTPYNPQKPGDYRVVANLVLPEGWDFAGNGLLIATLVTVKDDGVVEEVEDIVLIDDPTGVSVVIPHNIYYGLVDGAKTKLALKVVHSSDETKTINNVDFSHTYDIKIYIQEFEGERIIRETRVDDFPTLLTVNVPVPAELNGGNALIAGNNWYYIGQTMNSPNIKTWDYAIKDDFIQFDTNHFSCWGIGSAKPAPPVGPKPAPKPAPAPAPAPKPGSVSVRPIVGIIKHTPLPYTENLVRREIPNPLQVEKTKVPAAQKEQANQSVDKAEIDGANVATIVNAKANANTNVKAPANAAAAAMLPQTGESAEFQVAGILMLSLAVGLVVLRKKMR